MLSLKRLGLPPSLTLQSSESVINVNAGVGSIDYTSNNANIDLGSEIQVGASIGQISYNSNPVVVSETGSVSVVAAIGEIDYNSNNVTITLDDGSSQDIYNVTVKFKNSPVSVSFSNKVN